MYEQPIEAASTGANELVALGWGKSETQFQGKAGKLAQQPKIDEVKVPADDGAARVMWRGDGEYFVTSTITVADKRRRLHIWDRQGSLQSISEDVPGLEQSLAWKPSGNLIASTQRLPHRHDVVFFERNGLRHNEFTLPFKASEVQVLEMSWNCDSSVLAILVEDLPPTSEEAVDECEPKSSLLLWTQSNYHWYLKQEFCVAGTGKIYSYSWATEDPLRLFIAGTDGQVDRFDLERDVDVSQGLTACNLATVAVCDGDRLLLTPLRSTVVPPPMSAHTITFSAAIDERCCARHISFAPTGGPPLLAVLFSNGSLRIFSYPVYDTAIEDSSMLATLELSTAVGVPAAAIRQLVWSRCESNSSGLECQFLFAVSQQREPSVDLLAEASCVVPDGSLQVKVACVLRKCTLPGRVLRIRLEESAGPASCAAMAMVDGSVLMHEISSIESALVVKPWPRLSGSGTANEQPSTRIAVIPMRRDIYRYGTPHDGHGNDYEYGIALSDDDEYEGGASEVPANSNSCQVLVQLNRHGQLFLDGMLLVSNCNSFAVHDMFLVFTTHKHQCHFVSLDCTAAAVIAAFGKNQDNPGNETVRELERGSRIVAVVPHSCKLVLQMPRGNLETIWPRALVFSAARSLLDRLEYGRAFKMLRRHRVSLSLLYDHNPQQFESDVLHVVSAIGDPASLNLFLSDVRDVDVALNYATMASPDSEPRLLTASIATPIRSIDKTMPGTKRDRVAALVREAVTETDPDRYLLTTVHSHIIASKPELELALEVIRSVRDRPDGSGIEIAGKALNYASVITKDIELLYSAALGTYDFDLAVMVAEAAQKDPREYLPFLDDLDELDEPVRKYKVDMHLKRYEKALRHLASAGDEHFKDCLTLIAERNLHSQALAIYEVKGDSVQLAAVQHATALVLTEKCRYREAGIMLCRCGELAQALDQFKEGLEWRWCFSLAVELSLSDPEVAAIGQSLIPRLVQSGRAVEAAEIAQNFMADNEAGIALLVQGESWDAALMMATRHGRKDMHETHIRPAALQVAASICEGFVGGEDGGLTTMFRRHSARLAVVRAEKAAKALIHSDDEGADGINSDLYSDTSSVTTSRASSSTKSKRSGSSRSSSSSKGTRTHRSKRRAARKTTSLREGGVFEEAALLDALNGIAERLVQVRRSAPELCGVLDFLGECKAAAAVETATKELGKMISESFDAVWGVGPLMQSTPLRGDTTESVDSAPLHLGAMGTANAAAAAFRSGDGGAPAHCGHAAPIAAATAATKIVSEILVSVRRVKVDDVLLRVPERLEGAFGWSTF